MPVFQISSRIVPQTGPTGIYRWRYLMLRLAAGGLIIAALPTLLGRAGLSFLFFLLLSMNDQPGEQDGLNLLLEWTVASIPGNEQQAMEQVAEVVSPSHLSDERLADLKMAVAEAVMNAMKHGNAYQPDKVVTIQVLASQTSIVVRIRDQGEGHPIPETIATPDLDAKLAGLQNPYGWGLFLIKNLVDELHVTNDEHSHMVELVMRLENVNDSEQKL